MSTKDDLPEVTEHEETIYGYECPGCGDWHEEGCSRAGKIIECVCGQKFKVKR